MGPRQRKILAALRAWWKETNEIGQVFEAYDTDDYLASWNFKPKASAKDQRIWTDAASWAWGQVKDLDDD